MKRLIDQELRDWGLASKHKPLLLRGARQVGKTFAVRKLGKSYEDFYEINLEKRTDLHTVFEKDLDPKRILKELSIDRGAPILPGKTLPFLDEVQAFPRAIIALRYFYEEMADLDVVAAGSLLEFAIEQVGVPVGRIEMLTIFPMSFAEFLAAKKETMLLEAICNQEPSSIVHRKAIPFLSEYLAVGGLPEVVASWSSKEDLGEVQNILSGILTSYRQDFEKYGKKHQLKYLHLLLQHIPLQIGGKFKYHDIGDYRKRELAPCLELMEKAHIIHPIYHTSGHGIPLGAEASLEKFKVIFFDVGLTQQLLGLDLRGWFLNPEASFANQGSLVECFVGTEILAYSPPEQRTTLYYWHREVRGSEAEVDYLTTKNREVIPIEVKAGKGSTLKSLHAFLASHNNSPFGVKLSLAERSQIGKIVAIPLTSVFEVVTGALKRVQSLLS